jgi:adenine-specific DNA-methyltransferase
MTNKPEHIDRLSADGAQLNIDALYKIMPSAFTEAADPKTGAVRRMVDFDALRQLLGDNIADEEGEMYQFTWVGKRAAKAEAARPTSKTLRPVVEDSKDWDTTKNIYIEGDNLEVLKLLQRSYMGRVKMIYIDPPYNRDKDLVYVDSSSVSETEYELEAGMVEDNGDRLVKNPKTRGRFHSLWCSSIYSRLLVCRSLLKADGVIFLSIDDNEVENLKKICNEVFGETNFVGQWNWYKSATPPNLSKKIKKNVEYVLCYQKGDNNNNFAGIKKSSSSDDPITKPHNSIKELTFAPGTINAKFPDGVISAGIYGTAKFPNELLNDLVIENGVNKNEVTFRNKFIWMQDTLNKQIKNGTRINLSKSLVISYKKADYKAEVPPNFIDESVGVTTTENAGEELATLFDNNVVFSYPKPVSLIEYLVNFDTPKDDTIILDFFSGSSTTAEAIMSLNAKDGGSRKSIMVQLPEDLDESLKKTDGAAREIIQNAIDFLDKIGKPHTICEIGKERIRRAGKKIKADSPLTTQDLDTGFRVFRLDESNYENVSLSPSDYKQDQLDLFADNIKADRTDLDLLFGAMLSWGVTLDLPMKTCEVDGCKIYTVNGGDLVACFSKKITEGVVHAMTEQSPLRVLFRDACFDTDDKKINIYEQFKQAMDWTDTEAFNNIKVI